MDRAGGMAMAARASLRAGLARASTSTAVASGGARRRPLPLHRPASLGMALARRGGVTAPAWRVRDVGVGRGARGRVCSTASAVKVERAEVLKDHPHNNVTELIFEKIGRKLHREPDHPLGIIKTKIRDYFEAAHPGEFELLDDLHPVVSAHANFDSVLVPPDHVSRSMNDTYYVDETTVLRCHTSAHQAELLAQGKTKFLAAGDVYRRDSIDCTHYPVFHQMEGVRVFEASEWEGSGMTGTQFAEKELKGELEGLMRHLFGDVECRWVDAYFPFTEPSAELEIFYQGEWLEVLGCGVMEKEILRTAGKGDKEAWAFGLGLERLAMVLFKIPDIRLFWTEDKRFTSQFKAGQITPFKSYSKYPPCYKDVAFWISDSFTENNLCELVRGVGGDLIEEVKLIDEFANKKTGKTSHCYRIAYRSMDRSLEDTEINALQDSVREKLAAELLVELR